MGRVLPSLILIAAAVGCAPKTPESAKASSDQMTGPVVEQLTASPYLYLRIKTSSGDVWAAVPEAKVEKGAVVTVSNPMRMTDFESASLKRTFAEVYFGTLASGGETAMVGGGNPHAGIQSAAPVDIGKVEKATGPGAVTVSELWAKRADLAGETVTLRGVVVKYNADVMGKNWIHLQDGSGATKDGTNDITVTSLDSAATGETVTIRGTVGTNKDFGAGYTYPIIVEGAKVARD